MTEYSDDDDRDYWTVRAMIFYGGSFDEAIGRAAQCADDDNLARMQAAWPQLWGHYANMGLRLKRMHNAMRPDGDEEEGR